MTRETTRRQGRRYAQLVFVAAVTAMLLALVVEQTERGLTGVPATLVYAFAAGFGLEFVASFWRGEAHRQNGRRQLQG